MKTSSLVVVAIALVAFSLTATWVASHTLWKGKDICMAGKTIGPCDSWMLKYQHPKIKIIDRKGDK